jgi:hypothetical protein
MRSDTARDTFEPPKTEAAQGLMPNGEEYPAQFSKDLNREKHRKLKQKNPSATWPKGFLKKPNRDDKTPLELFLAGIRGGITGLRRILGDTTTTVS